ncbi:hypothetical protein R3P38DRAFT_3348600 [Favolaschia claudopus]|uniref:Uncharacterized protein n=1 Tax=Favolaschia claudopus TaxID=2862362 RepID=A0AAW0CVX6_9AGAR
MSRVATHPSLGLYPRPYKSPDNASAHAASSDDPRQATLTAGTPWHRRRRSDVVDNCLRRVDTAVNDLRPEPSPGVAQHLARDRHIMQTPAHSGDASIHPPVPIPPPSISHFIAQRRHPLARTPFRNVRAMLAVKRIISYRDRGTPDDVHLNAEARITCTKTHRRQTTKRAKWWYPWGKTYHRMPLTSLSFSENDISEQILERDGGAAEFLSAERQCLAQILNLARPGRRRAMAPPDDAYDCSVDVDALSLSSYHEHPSRDGGVKVSPHGVPQQREDDAMDSICERMTANGDSVGSCMRHKRREISLCGREVQRRDRDGEAEVGKGKGQSILQLLTILHTPRARLTSSMWPKPTGYIESRGRRKKNDAELFAVADTTASVAREGNSSKSKRSKTCMAAKSKEDGYGGDWVRRERRECKREDDESQKREGGAGPVERKWRAERRRDKNAPCEIDFPASNSSSLEAPCPLQSQRPQHSGHCPGAESSRSTRLRSKVGENSLATNTPYLIEDSGVGRRC